ncbi:LuxR C-terminal-related transcriptional regulator [Streptomyces sp. NBC_01485]
MLGGVDGEPSHGPGHSRLGAEPAAGDNLANGVVATLAGRGVRTRAAAGTLAVLGAVGSPRCDGRTPEPEELVSSRTSEAAAEALGRWTTGLLPRTADQAVRAQAGRFDSQPNGHAKAEHDVAKLLSRAERRVARLVGLGQTNREIAGNLHITVSTVSQHLTRIYRKLGVQTRAELAKRVANIDPR